MRRIAFALQAEPQTVMLQLALTKSRKEIQMKTVLRFFVTVLCFFASTTLLRSEWVQTNGPYGGLMSSFAVNGTRLFAGGQGGVFVSTNNGQAGLPQIPA